MHHEGSTTTQDSFLDGESNMELARLIELDRLVTPHTGLFPAPVNELFPLFGEHEYRVLDLGCGPGGWALEVAYEVPELEVIGVDGTASMVKYADSQAHMQEVLTASFEVMEITKPLPFRDASFQYIHARFLVGLLRPEQWPTLVQECTRLLAPGGTLCLTEAEWSITTSRAYEQLKRMVARALWVNQQSLSPDGQDFGVTPLLGSFLRRAGYQQIQQRATPIEWSVGTAQYGSGLRQCEALLTLVRPFVLKMGMATAETYDALIQQMLAEMLGEQFCGLLTPLTVWGRMPGGEVQEA